VKKLNLNYIKQLFQQVILAPSFVKKQKTVTMKKQRTCMPMQVICAIEITVYCLRTVINCFYMRMYYVYLCRCIMSFLSNKRIWWWWWLCDKIIQHYNLL